MKPSEMHIIMRNYEDDSIGTELPYLEMSNEKEKEIAEQMILELREHQIRSGGWYYSNLLFENAGDEPTEKKIKEKVYRKLVAYGVIRVYQHEEKCALDKLFPASIKVAK